MKGLKNGLFCEDCSKECNVQAFVEKFGEIKGELLAMGYPPYILKLSDVETKNLHDEMIGNLIQGAI